MIQRLGAVVIESQNFDAQCTHILVEKPSRSEKYLAGCASGKWILKPSYVDASLRAGKWEDETPFEWTAADADRQDEATLGLYSAPRRWRTRFATDAASGWCDL